MSSNFYERCSNFESIIKKIDSTYEESDVIDGNVKFYRYRAVFVPIIAQILSSSSNIKLFIPVVTCKSWYVNDDTIKVIKKGTSEYAECQYEFGKKNINYSKFYLSNKHNDTLFVTCSIPTNSLTLETLKNASKNVECAYFGASKIAKQEKYYLHSEIWMVN